MLEGIGGYLAGFGLGAMLVVIREKIEFPDEQR